jgi:hypothetical protein
MSDDTAIWTAGDVTVSVGSAQVSDDMAQDEVVAFRQAALALEAFKHALRAHGMALVGWVGADWYVWTWRLIPPIPLVEQPELPAPYQALRLAAYAMLADLIARKMMDEG